MLLFSPLSSSVALFKAGGAHFAAVCLLDTLPSMPLCRRIFIFPQHLSLFHRSATAATCTENVSHYIYEYNKLRIKKVKKVKLMLSILALAYNVKVELNSAWKPKVRKR